MAIHALLIFNNKGQPRLVSIYAPLSTQIQVALVQRIKTRIFDRPSSLSAGRSGRRTGGSGGSGGASSSTNTDLGAEEYAESNFLDGSEFAPVFLSASGSKGKARQKQRQQLEEEEESNQIVSEASRGHRVEGDREEEEEERLGRGWKIVWRNYATLYFACIVDESESPLGILDLIQVFVEALDRCFENVCELDLIFHFDEVHAILAEVIQGGLVLDTSLESICANASASARARKKSAAQGSAVAAALPGLADWIAPGGAAAGTWGDSWRREIARFTQ